MSDSRPDLVSHVAAALESLAPGPATALVAVSGGGDSVALLDVLSSIRNRSLEIVAAHFDHGIHPDSGKVAERVVSLAARLGVDCLVGRGSLGAGASETAARVARRTWLQGLAAQRGASYIITAHHADDQVETVLMRFLAGSGPDGLAGILPRQGLWVRPLLAVTRATLRRYLASRGLDSWQDPANREPKHLRSWIRGHLLPAVERRFPHVKADLLASGQRFGASRAAWDSLVNELPALDLSLDGGAVSVAAAGLVGYSSVVRQALLRALGRRVGVVIGARSAARVEQMLSRGRSGQAVDLTGGARAELSAGRVRLIRALGHRWDEAVVQGPEGALSAGDWSLVWHPDPSPSVVDRRGWVAWFPEGTVLVVRRWRAGDAIRPLGGRGSRLVVRCMQEQDVERARRPFWPVVTREGEIVWVPGVCRGVGAVPSAAAPSMRIEVRAL
ncbi:MAG: tRNA lysidine(34) synthetase TilS [Gemmatimonadetes bacterium]|nr:tRNA lysidine(34) synthetase TilS [Gemmatimonadota bacterium]